jgi:two-component system LytT family response regulator
MSIKTVIIEDEEKSLYVLQQFIHEFAGELSLCGSAGYINDAVRLIESTAPQLAFVDVCIADGTGFDVLQKLSCRDFELIFVTAYDNYALDAFKFAAIDYLLKPLGAGEFERAMQRARKKLSEKKQSNAIGTLLSHLEQLQENERKLGIPVQNGCEFIDLADILWCRSEGAYTIFYISNNTTIISCRNIGAYETLLIRNNFFRIHHSVIVNMRWVRRYVKGKGGSVVLADGTELEVSQRKKIEFLEKYLV